MIPKIIHQTTKAKPLSWEELKLQKRAQTVLKGYTFHVWDDKDNERIFESAFPQYIQQYLGIGRGVVKADIIRYVFLYAFGGIYLDTDYKILRNIDESLLTASVLLPVSRDNDVDSAKFRVCNSVMASEAGHPFWRDFIDHLFATEALSGLPEAQVEAVTGPEGLTDFYVAHRAEYSGIVTPPRRQFHPRITLYGLSYDRSYPSFGAHLCWGSWRTKPLHKKMKTFVTRRLTCLL